jgi:pimeloyl-ACP methyl ester carboxylesterase
VLCVYGERSACRAAGERLVRELPEARLSLLPCGHYPLAERPLELAGLVRDFLDSA